jgi:hypothetical protein
VSKQRAKGTAYENHVLETYLRPIWPKAERAPLKGTDDYGDFINVGRWLVEAKKRKKLQGEIIGWVNKVIGKTIWAAQKLLPGESASRVRKNAARRPWVIVMAGDKRSQPDIDLVVLPASLFFEVLEESE